MLTDLLEVIPTKNGEEFEWALEQLQKERLLHLLVTLTVGMATLVTGLFTLVVPLVALYVITFVLGVLFVAYLVHYRKLENTTQEWYRLRKKINN